MQSGLRILLISTLAGAGFALGLGGTLLFAVTVSGNIQSFQAGELISASQINTNFTSLRTAIESTVEPPVGSIVAWHKTPTGVTVPNLPDGWLECDGQTVSDTASVFNGQAVPNLNGPGYFLRGGATSETFQASQNLDHKHLSNVMTRPGMVDGTWKNSDGYFDLGWGWGGVSGLNNNNSRSNPYTTREGGSEARPINMSVVWIIRIK